MSQFPNKAIHVSHNNTKYMEKNVKGSSTEFSASVPPVLKRSQINVSKLIRGLSSGRYNSLFKSQGIEYAESNPYHYGDDSRYIDWNLSSRMNALHTKYFHEERNRTIWFMFDCSSSMNIGAPVSVYDIAMETMLTLASLALSQKDKIGAVIFDSDIRQYIPPAHVLPLVHRLYYVLEHSRFSSSIADLEHAVYFSKKILFQRSLIVVISDFLMDNCFETLNTLANSHDVLAIRVFFDMQANFPNGISMNVVDIENAKRHLISSNYVKKQYIENQSQLKSFWQRFNFRKGTSYFDISTTDSVLHTLASFLRNQHTI